MQKLCEIEKKLQNEHIDIKRRYIKLKSSILYHFVTFEIFRS